MASENEDTEILESGEPVESALKSGMEQLVDKIDVPDQLEPVIALFGNHPWVKGLIVLLIFIVLAKVVEWIVMPLVRKLTSHTSTHIDDLIVQYLRSPLFWTLALIGIVASSSMMGIDESVRSTLVSFVLSVLILLPDYLPGSAIEPGVPA
ncbi:MAG: hypothetical protein KME58_15830 [Candidatus Thiodiazotropha sp. (ex Lucina pensylvanica)]|nr:hypothetical protein [Candidatus Thiodiazotropha sp. (ex Lucina pensylvanica)]